MKEKPLPSKSPAYESPKLSYVGALSDLTSGGSGSKSESSKQQNNRNRSRP